MSKAASIVDIASVTGLTRPEQTENHFYLFWIGIGVGAGAGVLLGAVLAALLGGWSLATARKVIRRVRPRKDVKREFLV